MSKEPTLLDKLIVAMDAAEDNSSPKRRIEIVLSEGCMIARATDTNGRRADRRISLDMLDSAAWEYIARDIVEQAVAAL